MENSYKTFVTGVLLVGVLSLSSLFFAKNVIDEIPDLIKETLSLFVKTADPGPFPDNHVLKIHVLRFDYFSASSADDIKTIGNDLWKSRLAIKNYDNYDATFESKKCHCPPGKAYCPWGNSIKIFVNSSDTKVQAVDTTKLAVTFNKFTNVYTITSKSEPQNPDTSEITITHSGKSANNYTVHIEKDRVKIDLEK